MRVMILEDLPKHKCRSCDSENLEIDYKKHSMADKYYSECRDCGTRNMLEDISTVKQLSMELDEFVELIKSKL
jgi:peptide subunit release factor 1 (eRF1)